MSKPTQLEEEYFARLEFDRRRRRLAEQESRRILAVARSRRATHAPVADDSSALGSIQRIFTYS